MVDKDNVIALLGPEAEFHKIVYGNQKDKVDKALRFLMHEADNFLLLKHMIEFYHSYEEFEISLSEMVKVATRIRRKTLVKLPKQFKMWDFAKRYYAKRLINKVINQKH